MHRHRRSIVRAGLAACASAGLGVGASAWAQAATARIEVWKSPSCGCCQDWVKHLQANGFQVAVNDTGNAAARKRLGIPTQHGSCHTAAVGGYALEGHVPAREVRRLLAERPRAAGLAVPGMPIGSPGMEGEGDERDAFDVLLVKADGTSSVFARYDAVPRPGSRQPPAR